jgi:hypothetical protein
VTHVFISYVRQNSVVVDKLAAELSARGANVWLDRKDLGGGARWKGEIKKAIRNGDFFLACFSREYNDRDSSYMNEELTEAIEILRQKPTDRTWFIPVLIGGGHIPPRRISSVEDLSDLNGVDLSDWNDGIARILKTIGLDDPNLARALRLVNVARDFNLDESLTAIEQFGQLKLADGRILSVLVDATASGTHPLIKEAAVRSLSAIGRDAVPALAIALATAEEVSRKAILHALRKMGPAAEGAVPQILAILQENQGAIPEDLSTVQERAVLALAFIGPAAEDAVPYLGTLLRSGFRDLRSLAAFALTKLGPAAVPTLEQAINDPAIQTDAVAGILWADAVGSSEQAMRILRRVGSKAIPGLTAVVEGDHKAGKDIKAAAEAALRRL